MTRQILIKPRAVVDLDEQLLHLSLSSLRVAQRFQQAVRLSFQRLAQTPDLGELLPSRKSRRTDFRVWPVRGFPNHLIYFREIAGGIEIVRLLHGTRDVGALLDE
jgi:toxin ParE1/3/4